MKGSIHVNGFSDVRMTNMFSPVDATPPHMPWQSPWATTLAASMTILLKLHRGGVTLELIWSANAAPLCWKAPAPM